MAHWGGRNTVNRAAAGASYRDASAAPQHQQQQQQPPPQRQMSYRPGAHGQPSYRSTAPPQQQPYYSSQAQQQQTMDGYYVGGGGGAPMGDERGGGGMQRPNDFDAAVASSGHLLSRTSDIVIDNETLLYLQQREFEERDPQRYADMGIMLEEVPEDHRRVDANFVNPLTPIRGRSLDRIVPLNVPFRLTGRGWHAGGNEFVAGLATAREYGAVYVRAASLEIIRNTFSHDLAVTLDTGGNQLPRTCFPGGVPCHAFIFGNSTTHGAQNLTPDQTTELDAKLLAEFGNLTERHIQGFQGNRRGREDTPLISPKVANPDLTNVAVSSIVAYQLKRFSARYLDNASTMRDFVTEYVEHGEGSMAISVPVTITVPTAAVRMAQEDLRAILRSLSVFDLSTVRANFSPTTLEHNTMTSEKDSGRSHGAETDDENAWEIAGNFSFQVVRAARGRP